MLKILMVMIIIKYLQLNQLTAYNNPLGVEVQLNK